MSDPLDAPNMSETAPPRRLGQTLDRDLLERSVIIFNHIPKVGGTSLIRFFEDLFGPERCFRHKTRDGKTNTYSPAIEDISDAELAKYRFIAGHFGFGHHTRIDGPVLHIGVVRRPVERIISHYYFNKQQGREDLKKEANSKTLDEYVRFRLNAKRNDLVRSAQYRLLTGQEDPKKARGVVKYHYLAACTTQQLNEMQTLLAQLFKRPDLSPRTVNKTKEKPPQDPVSLLGPETRAQLQQNFEIDEKFVQWTGKRFDEEYRYLSL